MTPPNRSLQEEELAAGSTMICQTLQRITHEQVYTKQIGGLSPLSPRFFGLFFLSLSVFHKLHYQTKDEPMHSQDYKTYPGVVKGSLDQHELRLDHALGCSTFPLGWESYSVLWNTNAIKSSLFLVVLCLSCSMLRR